MEIIITIAAIGMLAIGYTMLFNGRNAAPAETPETQTNIQI